MKRIGPSMQAAVEYVAAHPGCAILPVAKAVGPHGSAQFGYRSVHRAIKARLLVATRANGRYALTVA
jgi:hypothetical protein